MPGWGLGWCRESAAQDVLSRSLWEAVHMAGEERWVGARQGWLPMWLLPHQIATELRLMYLRNMIYLQVLGGWRGSQLDGTRSILGI